MLEKRTIRDTLDICIPIFGIMVTFVLGFGLLYLMLVFLVSISGGC